MRATLVYRDGDRAAVRLTPSWLARLLGARDAVVELERTPAHDVIADRVRSGTWSEWRSPATRRDIDHMRNGRLIRDALERVPVTALPAARVVSGGDGADDPPDVRIAKLEAEIRRIRLGAPTEPPWARDVPMPVPGPPRTFVMPWDFPRWRDPRRIGAAPDSGRPDPTAVPGPGRKMLG